MNRKPVSLNYEFGELNRLISDGFESKFGPGELPIKPKDKLIKCVIAPVFDYDKAGAALAWSYKEVAEAGMPSVYLIVGRCEKGFNTYLFGNWDTPLGVVKIDVNFGRNLIRRFSKLRNDSRPFIEDINVERQLPLLQFAKRDFLEGVRILPILIGDDVEYKDLVEFADALTSVSLDFTIICSANLTRYGKEFNYVPFVHGVKENLHIQDKRLIEFIAKLDSKEFYMNSKNIIDRNVLLFSIEVVRNLGGKQGGLLNYYTSGEIDNNFERSVGMGSIVFR